MLDKSHLPENNFSKTREKWKFSASFKCIMRFWASVPQINTVGECFVVSYYLDFPLLRILCTCFVWPMALWNLWKAFVRHLGTSLCLFALRPSRPGRNYYSNALIKLKNSSAHVRYPWMTSWCTIFANESMDFRVWISEIKEVLHENQSKDGTIKWNCFHGGSENSTACLYAPKMCGQLCSLFHHRLGKWFVQIASSDVVNLNPC